MSWLLDTDANHGNYDGCDDTGESCHTISTDSSPLKSQGYSNLHTRESHETFDNVRGRQRKKDSTSPTTPNTIVQVPCSVMEFMATVKVNR